MRILLPVLLAVGLNAACTKPAEPTVQTKLSPAQFVDIFVQLRHAQSRLSGRMQEYEAAKQEVLKKAGATEQDLRDFVKAHAHEVTLMAGVWDSVQSRISRGDTIAR